MIIEERNNLLAVLIELFTLDELQGLCSILGVDD
jgi:hypothetical protein